MEAINILRKFMELYEDRKKDLHMVIIDIEKGYDRVSREVQ